jgi:cation:H+ antiporter
VLHLLCSGQYNEGVDGLFVDLVFVLLSLVLILAAAELFTNGVEWLGAKLKLAEGAVGSVLAAVGTALPETIIPIVAIIADGMAGRLFTPDSRAQSIGLGAIIGAPFMLGTLAFFVVGITYVIARSTKRRSTPFDVAGEVIRSDIEFFMIAFSLGAGAGLLRHYWVGMPHQLNWLLAAGLVVVYLLYLRRVTGGGETSGHHGLLPLHIGRPLPFIDERDPLKRWILMQMLLALGLMFFGAHIFVDHLSGLALALGVNPLILALLIVPVATELPEKFNSVLWVSRGKDTLAMGNISGAMVFQSTFPISLGLLFLDWRFTLLHPAFISACFGLLGAIAVYIGLRRTNEVNPYALLLGGGLYLLYLVVVLLHLSGVIHLDVGTLPLGGH